MKKRGEKTIGRLIKEYRKAQGMSQMKLAEMVGVSYQQVQKYEKDTNNISIERLRQIANALGIPLKNFFEQGEWTVAEKPAVYGKLTDDEQLLLHTFRGIKDKKLKKTVLEFMKSISNLN